MPRGCEIKLKFENSEEIFVLKDMQVIKRMPLLNSKWLHTRTTLPDPILIPYPKESVLFIIEHIKTYRMPNDYPEKVPENYPEANALDLYDLRPILEAATHLEALCLMNVAGFLIAKKLEELPVEQVAEFMGLEYVPVANFYDEQNGWIRPSTSGSSTA
ncbi:Protein CBG23001 [Caenorhabditis briggsae]|uniref:Uncharacterized protein n=2 Tax=Caenorhabditis briggsae TaxID=6238 RepID=A0AAE9JF07_CAEBR|nr:Protein CBG23001 [Caenorhabditis briggsae]ULU03189.1 hypothetical protein L3Y34_002639 [Caenorhabditis briggsae]UMM25821.1 hypothetical protein L5515_005484 [Caenorhabditis briggsae]CAP39438.2 Protein CBG23001 [Caenorhabditis briggsae]